MLSYGGTVNTAALATSIRKIYLIHFGMGFKAHPI
jgi:hypothetical protein